MTRIRADLPHDDIKWLGCIALEQGSLRGNILSMIFRQHAAQLEGEA